MTKKLSLQDVSKLYFIRFIRIANVSNTYSQLINWRFVRDKIPQTRLFNIFGPNFYIDYGDMIVFSISVTASKWRPKNHFIGLSRRERRFSE